MAHPAQLIADLRAAADDLVAINDRLQALLVRYNEEGGSTFTDAFYADPANNGYDLTSAQLLGIIASIGNLSTFWAAGNGTNFSRALP